MSQLHQIALSLVKSLGPVLSKSLLKYFGTAEDVFKGSPAKLMKVPGIGQKRVQLINFDDALRKAEKELAYIEKNNVDVIFYTDERYPRRLKNCDDGPLLLYSKGSANFNTSRVVSIVGTRNATDYGKQLCAQLVEELRQYDVLIVSGLAMGIDACAHRESLRHAIPTVGVLGHGMDTFYPAANRSLAAKMQEDGAVLTEYPSGTIANRENFPERNRIVAGMADVTVVVEAGIKGGALITAEIANSYNRDVFAFPGRITDQYSEGCNFLIRHHKASLLTCIADLAFSMGWQDSRSAQPSIQFALPVDVTETERLILDIIRQNQSPLAIDDLSVRAQMPVGKLAIDLLNMEMQGYIRSLPGKMYVLG